jgi:hypothetical protein|tara:strand:+ start:316 stop:1146 length:831 start_codon:yes stop_codon:yes gene_type:complete
MKNNVLSDTKNYNDTLDKNTCVLFLKYIGLIHELIESIVENIYIDKKEYLKYIITKGIKNTSYIYIFLLLYTKNLDLTIYHTQKSILYYVEFISQIGQDTNNLLKLNSTDATIFIYKKTIFDINVDFRNQYIETQEIKNQMNTLKQYMGIYNTTIIMYIEHLDLKKLTLIDLQKSVFTTLYKIVELLIQIPLLSKKNNKSDIEELDIIYNIIVECNKYHKYSFINSNYLTLIESIIKKHFKKYINIDEFRNKLNEPTIENKLEHMSICKIVNYLSV